MSHEHKQDSVLKQIAQGMLIGSIFWGITLFVIANSYL